MSAESGLDAPVNRRRWFRGAQALRQWRSSQSFLIRQQTVLLYGHDGPPAAWERRQRTWQAAADKLASCASRRPARSMRLVVYDIQDEDRPHRCPARPFPFNRDGRPARVRPRLSGLPTIVLQVARQHGRSRKWRAWLAEVAGRTSSSCRSSAGQPRGVRYPLSLSRAESASRRAQRSEFHRGRRRHHRAAHRRAQRGGTAAGEEHRGAAATSSRQTVYHAPPTQRLLADYLRDCPRRGGRAAGASCSPFAPCGREKRRSPSCAGPRREHFRPDGERHPQRAQPAWRNRSRSCRDNLRRILDGRLRRRRSRLERERGERVDQPRRDRRQRGAVPRAARDAGRPMRRAQFAGLLPAASPLRASAAGGARARDLRAAFPGRRWRTACSNAFCAQPGRAPSPPIPTSCSSTIDEKSLAGNGEGGRALAMAAPWCTPNWSRGLAAQKAARTSSFDNHVHRRRTASGPQDDAEAVRGGARAGHAKHLLPVSCACRRRSTRKGHPPSPTTPGQLGPRPHQLRPIRRRWSPLVPPLILPKETHRRTGPHHLQGGRRRRRPALTSCRETVPAAGRSRRWPAPHRLRPRLRRPPTRDDLVLAWARRPPAAFRKVSFVDLYEDFNRSSRKRPAAEFAGKILIIGTAATGLQDLRVTPLDHLHPGAENPRHRDRET